jgi:L-rhamnose-H+ transport protein
LSRDFWELLMVITGVALAVLSGLCNGLFTMPMKLNSHWKWENIWFVFIIVACLLMPAALVFPSAGWSNTLVRAPRYSVFAALSFGFAWGFGAICFGKSVHSIGVSMANTLVIGLSAALGSLVPLLMKSEMRVSAKQLVLFAGIIALLIGVTVCGKAGRMRDGEQRSQGTIPLAGYLFALAAGVMSAVFNIGYALALPISATGLEIGLSKFAATNCIWLLMLGAGSVPNIVYCVLLMYRNQTAQLLHAPGSWSSWGRGGAMGLLWGGSIFLYGAATPRLGALGPSVGWPLSLAVGLLVANLMGVLLGEWKGAAGPSVKRMWVGIEILLAAIVLCGISTRFPE